MVQMRDFKYERLEAWAKTVLSTANVMWRGERVKEHPDLRPLPYDPMWADIICEHIKAAVERSGAEGVILGLSGGLDSSVVAHLAVRALGRERVAVVLLPSRTTPPGDMRDARKIAENLGVEWEEINISRVVDAIKAMGGGYGGMALGNVQARIRMVFIYYLANGNNLLVLGTGNKTELLLGYFTKYGDSGSDLLPIGDLYKTQVRMLARDIGVPEEIINKKPTAGLLPGQYDEDELGYTYEVLDTVLWGIERGLSDDEISEETGIPLQDVQNIRKMVLRSAHKRGIGFVPKIGLRTVGIDWREDRTW